MRLLLRCVLRPATAVRVTVPSLRLLVPVPLRNFTEEGRVESHGRVQSVEGFPSSAPGRGKLRREVGGFKRGGDTAVER